MAPSFLIMLEHSSIQQRFTGCLLCIGPAGQVCAGVWEKLQTYRTHTHTQGIVTKLRTEAASVVHPAVSQRPRRRWMWRASQFSGWWHPLMPGTQKDSDNSAVFAAVEGTVASPRGFVNLSELPSASGLFFSCQWIEIKHIQCKPVISWVRSWSRKKPVAESWVKSKVHNISDSLNSGVLVLISSFLEYLFIWLCPVIVRAHRVSVAST